MTCGPLLVIQTVVQHHPSRAHLLAPLLAALPPDAQVVADPGSTTARRSPIRCYLECLRTIDKPETHLVVVQDDAVPCRDFPAALEAVVAARRADLLALFVPGVMPNSRRVLDACWEGKRWAQLDPATWVPAVALAWPAPLAARFLAWYGQAPRDAGKTADDGLIGEWARAEHVPVWACVPSLVEHSDTEPSLVGTAHFGGLAPNRVAACWTGRDWSPLEFDWCV